MSAGIINFQNKNNNSQTFTSGGNFTVPLGVNELHVFGCGGGGGGGNGYNTVIGGGAGGNSGQFYDIRVTVTPGATLPVVIGAGGAGGTSVFDTGIAGTVTTFSGQTWRGGYGGGSGLTGVNSTLPNAGSFSGFGGDGNAVVASAETGQDSIFASGGGVAGAASGGGGGAAYGAGGNGTASIGSGAGANTGGGGGGCYDNGDGGSGGSGVLIIRW